ncbi:cobalt-precorrin-6A reductase [Rhodobacter sp. CZR27]|uniref:cobalt-precorrin-6A reductase n=1 Tax=Rhodobacter sp. CZR27 TaxID=2033869 RepID=UPI000BBE24D4|nr:cobalt-precorrin-6A reductase [Rhodobacter sp. CZR27]
MRILLLGGTTEASRMARALVGAGLDAVFSYAGRTAAPVAQPLPMRVGGFGGVEGLADWLRRERISHVIDATHPFAAQMSRNAVEACALTGTQLVALERAPWQAGEGDRWTLVSDLAAAAAALPEAPARVFLAIGRQHLDAFAGHPQHRYLLRLVDPPDALPLPRAEAVIARGPFTLDEDLALMRRHGTQIVVAKNAGGEGARAKLDAARMLGLPVILIDRPAIPERPRAETPEAVMAWLGFHADLGV